MPDSVLISGRETEPGGGGEGGEEEAGGRRGELREKEEGGGWHSDEDGQTDGQTNNVFI